ncbi:hypothetical protein [Clostridium perfringens]|uniref:hypothetical protein n=1 Tax=Clostridium perfringens TaxID=1502 RepID=UPI0024BC88FC|nr:hypothetical protein [Clostridium perfringens]MDZ5022857.1 hypothetical protein [Clostridium perfringens]MDZ5069471.1 hypothetical protein [Clostridium perfringens]MDZ5075603.1 hypothetical protein [Clostridium perfringens]
MKVKINDKRVSDTTEREVFTYSEDEKETILNFDYRNKVWNVWTSVPTHITKLLKLKNNNFIVGTVTNTGAITSIKGTLRANQISFRSIIELSEERKEELKKIGKKLSLNQF